MYVKFMFLHSELSELSSLVGIVTRPQCETTRELFDFWQGQRCISLPLCPDQLSVPPSVLFQWVTVDLHLTTHLHLVLKI